MSISRKLGQHYENQAIKFLSYQGLQLIAQNSYSRLGEIDLIMQDNSCLVFVEVKYRKNALYGDAQSTVTEAKQHRIICAAYDWMQKQNINIELCEFRFDIFAITGHKQQWIKNAFVLE